MPFVSGKASSIFHVGAKTWRPKTAEQQLLEVQRQKMVEEEQMKKVEVQQRIKTLDQVRKLEEKTQALNELALSAELKAKEHELALRERQVNEAKHLEIAKLEIAKREGRESLSEADLARIKNERLRTEALARAARDHAVRENHRPVTSVNMGPSRVHAPPPPPALHPLPPQQRPPSAQSIHRAHPPSSRIPSGPISNASMGPRLGPPEPAARMRRMSESLAHPPPGVGRTSLGVTNHPPRGLGHAPHANSHARRHSANITAEMALRAQAERLRRRKLETLDLKARQHNLKVQALRDLRKRELVAELRERGLQQREIETQVNLQAERERAFTEAQLREIRDRDHRLKLKEKGLQEREILDHLRRRQENDREALRRELELLEHQLRRKEILEAELSIKRAMEKGESPPLGIARPSIEEIETEGLLNDLYDDFDMMGPYLRHEAISDSAMSAEYRPRTPSGFASVGSRTPSINPLVQMPSAGHLSPHLNHHAPPMMGHQAHGRLHEEQMRRNEDMHMRQDLLNVASSRAPTPRHRDGPSRQATPQPHRDTLDSNRLSVGGRATPHMRGEEVLGDNLTRTPGRSRSQSFDHRRPSSAAMTARDREESRNRARESSRVREESRTRPREESRSRHNSQLSLNREDVMSIARAESRAALREELGAREREQDKAQKKAIESQRLRDELRAREEHNRMSSGFTHLMATPSMSQLGTPSMGHHAMSNQSMGHQMMPNQSMSRQMTPAPSVGHQRTPSMMDNLEPNYYHDAHHLDVHVRPSSRASSRVHDFDSISRPASRGGSIRADYSPMQPRLGLPSRPSSRNLTAEDLGLQFDRESTDRIPHMNTINNDELLSARLESAALNSEINGGKRSRANSRLDPMDGDYLHTDRSHLAAELSAMNLNGGRSRTNSRAEMPGEEFLRSARSQLGHDFEASNNTSGMRSRSNSRLGLSNEALSPNARRDHLGSDIANIGGRRSRASSITQPHPSGSNFQADSELNGNLLGLGRSPRGHAHADLYASQNGLGNLTHDELSQFNSEELELILNGRGDRSPMRNAASPWAGSRGNDRLIPSDELGPRHSRHESGSMGGMNTLDVGDGRSHNHRNSRLAVEDSPLFGDPRDYHSPIDPPRPLSRAETSSSRQYGGPSSVQRYDQPSEASMIRSRLNSPNMASSVYNAPYHDPYLAGNGYLQDDGQGGRFDSESGYMDENDFIITEKSEHPGARIMRRFGPVEASSRGSPRSAGFGSRYNEMNDRQDTHQAVKNLITEANQRGANGVVSLRVCDAPDGGYIATGEAVLLETI